MVDRGSTCTPSCREFYRSASTARANLNIFASQSMIARRLVEGVEHFNCKLLTRRRRPRGRTCFTFAGFNVVLLGWNVHARLTAGQGM